MVRPSSISTTFPYSIFLLLLLSWQAAAAADNASLVPSLSPTVAATENNTVSAWPSTPPSVTVSPTLSPVPSLSPTLSLAPTTTSNSTLSPVPTVSPNATASPAPSPLSLQPSQAPSASNTPWPTYTPAPTHPEPTPQPSPGPPTPQPSTPSPTTQAPTTAPSHQKHHRTSLIGIFFRTLFWLIVLALALLGFGFVMTHRYRIYYTLRAAWFRLLRSEGVRRFLRFTRLDRLFGMDDGPGGSSSLNEIIFDSMQEGLLMQET